MSGSDQQPDSHDGPQIDSLDFDANRGIRRSNWSRHGRQSLLDDDVDFMGEVAQGILERDRQKMRREVIRTLSFVCAILSWYACFALVVDEEVLMASVSF